MKKILKYTYLVFIIIILTLAYIFIKNNFDYIEDILKISFLDFLVLSLLTLITITLNGNKIEILTRYYNLKLKFKEWFGLSVLTTVGNYLAPFGLGMSFRGAYLKKKYKFSYTLFLTTLAASYLTSFLLYGLIGLFLLGFIYFKYKIFNLLIILIFLLMFLISLLIIISSPKLKERKNKLFNRLVYLINNWNVMKKDFKLLFKLSLNDLFILIISSMRIFIIFSILSNKIPFIFSILIALIATSSSIIGITPASIGIKEALITYAAIVIGKSFDLGILVATIDRGISIIYVFVLGGIFSYILLKQLKDKNL